MTGPAENVQDIYQASRRQATVATPEQNRFTMHNNPNYHHSLDNRSNNLKPFLEKVPAGIVESAHNLNLTLHPQDTQWLASKGGFFQLYVSRDSRRCKEITHRKKHRNKTNIQHFLDEIANNQHIVMDRSPRFKDKAIAANTVTIYEQALASLWNFLALLGDYQSMIILLPHPPRDSPSVHARNLKLYMTDGDTNVLASE